MIESCSLSNSDNTVHILSADPQADFPASKKHVFVWLYYLLVISAVCSCYMSNVLCTQFWLKGFLSVISSFGACDM